MRQSNKNSAEQIITQHIDIWTSAIKRKNTQGRGSSKKIELYGIKKLRELILELAVRGLLVPQDPNDEPASVLLERVAKEKEQLVKEKRIKKQKALPPIGDDERPFEVPDGWEFRRFSEVLDFSGGSQPPKSTFSDEKLEGYVQLIQIRDLGPSPQPVYVPRESVSKFCSTDDVMIGRYGASVGKVFWGKDGAYNVALIKLHNELNAYIKEFLHLLMSSPLGQSLFSGISRSAQAGFSKSDIEGNVIPVIPHNEQTRIVNQVNELMALCNQLEQKTESSLDAHNLLVDTLLSTLTDARDAKELSDNWARLADHFDTLITTDYAVEQLKQIILQLAVQGKLVPQDPNDEPASELLKRIAAEKEQLIKDKKIKKQNPLPPIEDDEKPFEIPEGWECVRLQDVTKLITDGKHGDCNNLPGSGYYFLSAKNIQRGELCYDNARQIVPEEFREVHQRTDLEPGDICMVNTGATVGKMAIALLNNFTNRTTFQKSVAVIKAAKPYCNELYLALFLQAESKKLLKKSGGSAINNLLLGDLKKRVLLLPPLKEQLRITTKVDELMILCNQLKTRLNDAQITQLHLADAITEQALPG